MIPIDRNVPVPERAGQRGPTEKYPWSQMEVGDSFVVGAERANTVRGCYVGAGKRLGRKFATRMGSEGLRVWRIA